MALFRAAAHPERSESLTPWRHDPDGISERALTSFPIFAHHGEQRAARIAEFRAPHPPGTKYWIVSQWIPADDVRRKTCDAALAELDAKLEAELVQMEIYSAELH